MYQAVFNKNGSLKHSPQCTASFGRKDLECHRCVELLNGAPARDGWQKDYFTSKQREEANQVKAIREHFDSHHYLSGDCGPVCTFGDN